MHPFEELSNLMSHSEGTISDLIPYAFFLEHALQRVVDQAVEERDQEEEELWAPSPPPEPDLSLTYAVPAAMQMEESSEEEESEEEGDFEEEVEEQLQQVLHPRGLVVTFWLLFQDGIIKASPVKCGWMMENGILMARGKTMLRGAYDKRKREEKRAILDQLQRDLETRYHRTWSVKKIQTMWSDFKSKTPCAVRRIKDQLRELDRSQARRRARSASAPPSSRNIVDPTQEDPAAASPPADDEAGPSNSQRPRSSRQRGRRRCRQRGRRRSRSRSVASSISVRLRRRRPRQLSSGRPESGAIETAESSEVTARVAALEQQVQQQRVEYEARLQQLQAAFQQQIEQLQQQLEAQIEDQRQRILACREEGERLHEYFAQVAGKRRM
ncbi:myosin-10-like [Hyperolius riggenbachi]|uniref:myosin-10-like n=1 Tax=Hyperolius riggenbachi TaxID=752182 RepID=UPI0035A3AC03